MRFRTGDIVLFKHPVLPYLATIINTRKSTARWNKGRYRVKTNRLKYIGNNGPSNYTPYIKTHWEESLRMIKPAPNKTKWQFKAKNGKTIRIVIKKCQ